ncbi:hypothetical protein IJX73_03870 [bacterium]|nr:hypothetical protein [bacterium]MBQ9150049.1 hypothetical protein [bacterium]
MNIIALNNIAFQKKLIASSNIIKDGQISPCSIYELDVNNRDDLRYFTKLKGGDNWRKGTFFKDIENDMLAAADGRYYVLEDSKDGCLAACEVYENTENGTDELIYLETGTTYSSQNSDRKSRYIGETLLSFLVGMAKKTKKAKFTIVDPTPYAYMFYINHGFRENVFDENLSVKSSDFNRILEKNEKHVGRMEYFV